MSFELDKCPHCGRKMLKGAMKCLGCGKIHKTTEEQVDSIHRHMETKKNKLTIGRLIKFVLLILAMGITYYFFKDQLAELISKISGK